MKILILRKIFCQSFAFD